MSFCRFGHGKHASELVRVEFDQHLVPDYPNIGKKFPSVGFDFNIFNASYDGQNNYCPADDEVSRSIRANNVWEGFETLLFLDIISQTGGTFVDFGPQLGWYSKLASLYGMTVIAYEADPENIRMSRMNVDGIDVKCVWIDEDFTLDITSPITVAKADLEGSEIHALNACRNHFATGQIDYFLLEVTPQFANYSFLQEFLDYGYGLYEIPDKGCSFMGEFESEPLETVLDRCKLSMLGINEGAQINVLLAKGA